MTILQKLMRKTSYLLIGSLLMMTIGIHTVNAGSFDDSITINSVNLTLDDDADSNGIANIGDTIRVEVDIDNSQGACDEESTTGEADLLAYGGDVDQALSCTGINGGVNDILSILFEIADAAGLGIDVLGNDDLSKVDVAITDSSENDNVGNPDPTVGTSNSFAILVDTIAPTLTNTDLSADVNACTGESGTVCIIGDTITFEWDNSGAGTDDNADVTTVDLVEFDLTNFGGAEDENPDSVSGGVFTLDFTVLEGDTDGIVSFSASITDDGGNPTGPVVEVSNSDVDNEPPILTSGNLIADESACTGDEGTVCVVGDEITFTWDAGQDEGGDVNNDTLDAVEADLSNFGGPTDQPMFDDGASGGDTAADNLYTFVYTVEEGDDDGDLPFSVSVTDDAGNVTGPVESDDTAPILNFEPGSEPSGGGGGGGLPILLLSGGTSGTPATPSTTTTTTTTALSCENLEIASPFTDIDGHWGEDYIETLRSLGVVHGEAPGIFNPDGSVSRAELVKMVILAFCINLNADGSTDFPDVDPAEWYAVYVATGVDMNFIEGYVDGTFRPNSTITRAEALAVILEASGLNIVGSDSIFPDTSLEEWYAMLLSYAIDMGIVDGYLEGLFGPNDDLSRAQAAKIIVRVLNLM